MHGLINWWSTISWADFAVGGVVAALVTGGFSIGAHIYNKKAALEALDINHKHEIAENEKMHEREVEKLRLQASDAEREAFTQLLTSFLREAYRYHDLNSETYSAHMDLYKVFEEHGTWREGSIVLDPDGIQDTNAKSRYDFYSSIVLAGSEKMATVYKELGSIINEISAQSSKWGDVARETRSQICEVAYPNSHEPKANFTHPDQGQKAIDAFQAMLDATKKTPPSGSVFVPPQ